MDHKTILRQYLATLAFRCGYAINNTDVSYQEFDAGHGVWTPKQIMLHMANLLKVSGDYIELGKYTPYDSDNWDDIIKEYYIQLERLDKFFENIENIDDELLIELLQGPICDAMAHAGQLLSFRRMSGKPVDGKAYWKEKIEIGKFKYHY